MFIVLAIGSLMDVSQPAYNLEAEKYNQLARAALFQDSFFDSPTVTAVQALVRSISPFLSLPGSIRLQSRFLTGYADVDFPAVSYDVLSFLG